jgi:hypothetical protein
VKTVSKLYIPSPSHLKNVIKTFEPTGAKTVRKISPSTIPYTKMNQLPFALNVLLMIYDITVSVSSRTLQNELRLHATPIWHWDLVVTWMRASVSLVL